MTVSNVRVITIDGPGGTGKGTVGQLLAQELGWNFLDSGVLYRVLAWKALQQNMALHDEDALAELANQFKVEFRVEKNQN